jgi:hypothetical protein
MLAHSFLAAHGAPDEKEKSVRYCVTNLQFAALAAALTVCYIFRVAPLLAFMAGNVAICIENSGFFNIICI